MSRNVRDPVNQYGVEGNPSNQAQNKGLFRSLLSEDKKERNEGYPCEKGEIELRKGQRSQSATVILKTEPLFIVLRRFL